jgi:molybdopterin-guanine dinucleotide biosynthesis protein A
VTTTNPGDTGRSRSWRNGDFHPHEIAIVDPAGLFGDDLAVELARAMVPEFHIGVAPRPLPPASAAEQPLHVARFLTTPEQHVLAMPHEHASDAMKLPLLDLDAVFVQDDATSRLPKILIVGDGVPPEAADVFAYVADEGACPILPASAPFYTRGDVSALAECVKAQLRAQAEARPLYGLVLAGGESTRMGTDKALLSYHGKPQFQHCHDSLSPICDRVYVSIRDKTTASDEMAGLHQIPDRFLGCGPLGGVLTALSVEPDAAWLVLACDLPFADADTLASLLTRRNPFQFASAFLADDGRPEPLCAVYEPKSRFLLHQELAKGNESLRDILRGSRCALFAPPDPAALTNVNSKTDYEQRMTVLTNDEREDA